MKYPRVALLLDGSRSFDAGVLTGISQYVNLHRPWQLYRPASTSYQRFSGLSEVSWRVLKKLQPDGVVMHESSITKQLLQSGVPTVVIPISDDTHGAYLLTNDNVSVGRTAAEYLRNLGLKHYGFIGFKNALWSIQRQDAFQHSLASHNFAAHEYLLPLLPKENERSRLYRELTRWIKSLPKPIGVFTGNDDLARPVGEICNASGISVPDDIAILGVDNDRLICELSNPPLSSIPFASIRAGFEAAEMLDAVMQGKTPETKLVTAMALPVVVRRSTDMLAIDDDDVRTALRFIRENASQIIQVNDVVKATNLARRTLHNRFKACTGRSLMKEINRQRALFIASLLTETSQSISQISQKLGYMDDAHFVRFFKREMGESPGAYRRRRN